MGCGRGKDADTPTCWQRQLGGVDSSGEQGVGVVSGGHPTAEWQAWSQQKMPLLTPVGPQRSWWLLVPLRTREFAADTFTSVVLNHDPGDSETSESFPVVLKAAGGAKDMQPVSTGDYADAREAAITIAEILGLPVEDATSNRHVSLTAEQASETLAERFGRGNAELEEAPAPETTVSRISLEGDAVIVLIRSAKAGIGAWLGAIAPLAGLAYFLPKIMQFFRETETPPPIQSIFTAFLLLFFGVLPLLGALSAFRRARRGGTRVKVDWRGVIIQERSAWNTKTQQIRAEDIWDVGCGTVADRLSGVAKEIESRRNSDPTEASRESSGQALHPLAEKMIAGIAKMAKSEGVLLKTRQGIIPFGAGLPDAEIRYIRYLFERALAGQLD